MTEGLFGGGEGTAASPYIIEDALDLDAIRNNLSAHYELKNDIDLGIDPFNTDEGWIPIRQFSGVFYGNGKIVKNLFINRPEEDQVGLFGEVSYGGIIQDIFIDNANVTGKSRVGALVGLHYVSHASHGVYRCGSSGIVNGDFEVGGLVGYMYGHSGHIKHCYSKCKVVGDRHDVAGLVGRTYGTSSYGSNYLKVYNCLSFGKVESSNGNANSTISNQYRTYTSELYYTDTIGKPGVGTKVDNETLRILDIEHENFNEYFNGNLVWHFNQHSSPKLMYQVISYGEEPVVLLKTESGYFSKQDDWINLGEDFSLIDPFESGIKWTELERTEWWKHFTGEVEILLFSKTEEFNPSLIIIKEGKSLDALQDEICIEVSSLLHEPMETENKDLYIQRNVYEDSQNSNFEVLVNSNVHEDMRLNVDYSLLMEGNNTTDFSVVEQDISLDIDSNKTEDMTLEGERSVLMEGLNTVDNEAEDGALEVSSQKVDDTAVQQELDLIGEATSQLRTAISINGGRNWWTYNEEDEEWHPMELRNIDFEGMSIDLLNSLDYFAYEKLVPNKIYLKDLVIATQLTSTLEDRETIFRGLEVEYYENQAAFIKNATLTPDTIHNEYATLSFDVLDLEGDEVFYKVLVKRADEEEYVQVDPNPSEREWNKRKAEDSVLHAYNHPYFNKGLNKIKVVVKDGRGAVSENEFDLFLIDEKPWIQASHNQFGMSLVIGDERMDSVSYKVEINGEAIIGYTDFQQNPVSFQYLWRPGQLKRDEPNNIRIEVVDSFGNISVEEFQVQGQSTNIMFMDNTGEYLIDNLGQLLKYLDFEAIVGGTETEPKTVKVINETGSAIKNLEIKVLSDQLAKGVHVQMSKELMPFEETDTIKYSGVIPFQGEREFYVRIKSSKKAEGIHEFEAVASADTEI